MRELKYVSAEYQQQLDNLAETLMTSRFVGQLALREAQEFPYNVVELFPVAETPDPEAA